MSFKNVAAPPRRPRPYRQMPHTADLAWRLWGQTLSELFENAGRALSATLTDTRCLRRREIREVSLQSSDREALLVDARDAVAFSEGHLPRALSLPVGEAEARMTSFRAQVPTTQPLVTYCNGYSCHDSHTLAELLIKAGYRTVYVFAGGFPEWRDAGYPVEKGTP